MPKNGSGARYRRSSAEAATSPDGACSPRLMLNGCDANDASPQHSNSVNFDLPDDYGETDSLKHHGVNLSSHFRGPSLGGAVTATGVATDRYPGSPSPFLPIRRNRTGLLSWWTKWRSQIEKNSPADEAVGLLGQNLMLAKNRKYNNTLTSMLSVLAICIVVINFIAQTFYLDLCLSLVTVIHIVTIGKLYGNSYKRNILLKPLYGTWYPHILVSPLLPAMLLHMTLVALHVPPVAPDAWDGMRAFNAVVLLRGMDILQTIVHYTFVSSSGAMLAAALAGENIGPLFVYKMLLFKYPIVTISVTVMGGFLMLSCAIWFVESTASDWTFARSMWYTMVTFTTVGYGDEVPSSWPGRAVGGMTALFGITASAVLVSVVQHKLALSRIQKQIIMFLCEVQANHRVKEMSATIVTRSLTYNYLVKRTPDPVPEHRSVLGWLTMNSRARLLHQHYTKLIDAARHFKKLRSGEDGGTAWADISVLDVLQADTSDILAQNTVLQYLMRPADDSLSNQLRATKRLAFSAKRKSSLFRTDSPTGTNKVLAAHTPPSLPRVFTKEPQDTPAADMPEDARRSIESPKVRDEKKASVQRHILEQFSLRGKSEKVPTPPPADCVSEHSSESATSDMTDHSYQSSASQASGISQKSNLRTAASTKALVDLVRNMIVQEPESPPPQPVSKLHRSGSHLGQSLTLRSRSKSDPCPDPRGLRSGLGLSKLNTSIEKKRGTVPAPTLYRRDDFPVSDSMVTFHGHMREGSPSPGPSEKDPREDEDLDSERGQDSLGELMSDAGSDTLSRRASTKNLQKWRSAARDVLQKSKETQNLSIIHELRAQQQVMAKRQEEQHKLLLEMHAALQQLVHARPGRSASPSNPLPPLGGASPMHMPSPTAQQGLPPRSPALTFNDDMGR
ncbi:Small conductance calcium-activated potassium channel protein [Diplonema papillatum]|nr:Small conductance calcium-activated potassium channel protein [Diplonema papillatum]